MTSLDDIRQIVRYAAANGCKVIITGDHGQLRRSRAAAGWRCSPASWSTRSSPSRSGSPPGGSGRPGCGSAPATRRCSTEYDQHGRIRGGAAEQVLDDARRAYVAGYLAGRDVFLMAQSHDICRELSQRIREDLQHLGLRRAAGPRSRCGRAPGPAPVTSS